MENKDGLLQNNDVQVEEDNKIKKEGQKSSLLATMFKAFMALAIFAAAFYFLVYAKILQLGSLKQQSIEFEQIDSLTYPMKSETLPVH